MKSLNLELLISKRCITFSAALIFPAVMQKMAEITLIMIHLMICQLKVSGTGLDM